MRTILFMMLALLLNQPLPAQHSSYTPTSDALKAASVINTNGLMSHIKFLSHDLLEGRAPGTRGDVLARTYIASMMELLGLQPGGDDGTYFQRVPIVAMRTNPATTLRIAKKAETFELKFGDQFVGFSGAQLPAVDVKDAEIVFVGYGIVAPEQDWDDYKGMDVKGKILLMLNNDPAPSDPKVFGGKARTYYGRWTYKYEIAAKKGAAGAIVIHTTESAGYGWNVVESSWSRERFELERKPGTPEVKVNSWTTFEATQKILALAGKKFDDLEKAAQKKSFRPVPLGVTLSTRLENSIRRIETTNVLGVLQGTDPKLKEEAVVLTAHYDHLGIGKVVDGDSIYNGALDNSSGVSSMLNVACAFTTLPEAPRRTLVFAAVGGEESGLIGSQYYAENPTFPPAKIAANINIDGISIFGRTKDVVMIGLGKSNIDDVLRSVASWQGRVVLPDQFPEQGSFYRSDQFNFAKIGVPCMYARSGIDYIGKPADFGKMKVEEFIKKNYHQPSDELGPDWDLSGAVEDSQLSFHVGLVIANSETMPEWTKGDEFEGARLKALGK